MIGKLAWLGWLVGFWIILALVPEGVVLAGADGEDARRVAVLGQSDDDDGEEPDPVDDDDDFEQPAPVDDDDDFEELAPAGDDDDDDFVEPAPAGDDDDFVEPAPVGDDDNDDDFEQSEPVFADGGGEVDVSLRDQAIVGLVDGVDPNEFGQRYNLLVERVIPRANIVLIRLDPNRDNAAELQDLLDDDDVEWAELNFTAQAPEGRPRYFFSAVAGVPQVVDLPALPAGLEFSPDAACVTGAGVVVAVLDTGIDVDHPALAANVLPNGVNMVDNTYDLRDIGDDLDDDGDGQTDEMVGHGTHIAGAILQVAPNAGILPVKVLNSDGVGNAFTVTSGIYFAVEQGADAINLSLGSTYDSFAIRDAVDFAVSQDVIVVAAVGNGDRLVPVEFPAAIETSISVASTTVDADKTSYSNFHPTVEISAPGSNLASAFPGGLYVTASGSSMSTSLVTGNAALILERQPEATPEDVIELLQATSGTLNLSDPAHEGMLGTGEIDIDASISCAG